MAANEVTVKSPLASAMGARISITGPQRSMYLIIGRSLALESLVKAAGGEVVLKLSGLKMLAALSFTGYLSLRSNSQIAHIGPVSVDVKRLAKMTGNLVKANAPKPG